MRHVFIPRVIIAYVPAGVAIAGRRPSLLAFQYRAYRNSVIMRHGILFDRMLILYCVLLAGWHHGASTI